ncbi:MAG: response regulator transcription factor [Planctomycetota bacterium]
MRLLVVEDSARLCESLRQGLSKEGYSVDVSMDGREALALLRRNPFDLAVLDVMLPQLSGLEVLRELRAAGVDVPVLILTARDATEQVVEGFEAGADDYLVKPFAFDELLVRCRALLRRRYGKASSIVQVGALQLDTSARTVTFEGQPLQLAARDYKVLEYLAHRAGAIVRREELEDHVYRLSGLPNSNAVDAAIYAVRRKLGGERGGAYIKTVRGLGYVLAEPQPAPVSDLPEAAQGEDPGDDPREDQSEDQSGARGA